MAKSKPVSRPVLPDIRSNVARTLFIVGLLLLVTTGYIWWRQVMSSPRNVFTGMLENSLKTRSVAKRTVQESGVQELNQTILLQTGNQKIAHSLTTLSQTGDSTASVKTESLGTPRDDYVRYTNIQTNQTNQAGQPLNFENVLDVWGRSRQTVPDLTGGELYGEAVLGIVPFGYLPPSDREALLELIKERKVYAVDYGNVKRENESGRPRYTYSVEVNPEDYVVMLKQFASEVGLNQLADYDSADFKGSPKLQLEFTVDVWSRQLTKIVFPDSGRVETYGSYGAWVPTALPEPEEVISVEELQTRLQTVQ